MVEESAKEEWVQVLTERPPDRDEDESRYVQTVGESRFRLLELASADSADLSPDDRLAVESEDSIGSTADSPSGSDKTNASNRSPVPCSDSLRAVAVLSSRCHCISAGRLALVLSSRPLQRPRAIQRSLFSRSHPKQHCTPMSSRSSLQSCLATASTSAGSALAASTIWSNASVVR